MIGEAFVKVSLKHADAFFYARAYTMFVNFDAPSSAFAFAHKTLQQFPVATSEVEYRRCWFHQFDDFVVRNVRSVPGAHDPTSRLRSCEIVERNALIIGAWRSVSRRKES